MEYEFFYQIMLNSNRGIDRNFGRFTELNFAFGHDRKPKKMLNHRSGQKSQNARAENEIDSLY